MPKFVMGREAGSQWNKHEEIQRKITVGFQASEVGEFSVPLIKACKQTPLPPGMQKNKQVSGEKLMISPPEVLAEPEVVNQAV